LSYPSVVVGILGEDETEVRRVVVTQPSHIYYHVKEGERAVIVPGVLVREPVVWNRIPNLIELAKKAVTK
jgi:hypothetical protein